MADPMAVDTPSQGTKRKAAELDEPGVPHRIRALDQDVVNKIAAGEIIVAPVHALKELMENAVDAGSTSLEILVKDGGLKLLQITDNGCGISKLDLPILCERFTTSKLQRFEDLSSIATYGFRGEALASISHIAHLTVTTKTSDSSCAWRAHYDGGKPVPAKPGQTPEPKPVAGRPGTQITVEDLFYNVPTRRRAFRSASDEYNKIIDMVGRYAIHCDHVAFSCKKHGESSTSIAIQANATVIDRIRQIYGSAVANELIAFSAADDRWRFKARGWATNANYSIKKTTLLLFINNRCVESSSIRKAVEQTYASFLSKNGHPFVYLSLEIDPQRVDVNVHPTKREVNFLNEDEITQAVCEDIRSRMAAADASRTFSTQTLLPGGSWSPPAAQRRPGDAADETPRPRPGGGSSARKTPSRPSENNLIRTDTNLRKITSMLSPAPGPGPGGPAASPSPAAGPPGPRPEQAARYETTERAAVACRLTSIRELRAAVRDDAHHELTRVLAGHTFVGLVDDRRRLAAVQSGVKLYLVDYGRACFEYLYQLGLADFANFGAIRLSPPLDLRALLRMAAEHEHELDDDRDAAEAAVALVAARLVERREMLHEYLGLEISPAGELRALPLLVRGYTPALAKLPRFLLGLGPRVDWAAEKPCLRALLHELAAFYAPEQLPPSPADGEAEEGEEMRARRAHVRWAVEHVFFPAFKARLLATTALMRGGVLEIADLKGLYRVFERC